MQNYKSSVNAKYKSNLKITPKKGQQSLVAAVVVVVVVNQVLSLDAASVHEQTTLQRREVLEQ